MAERLSKKALQIILSGKVKEDAAVAVKFYSNGCHYCHSLKDAYEDLADEFDEEVFFSLASEGQTMIMFFVGTGDFAL